MKLKLLYYLIGLTITLNLASCNSDYDLVAFPSTGANLHLSLTDSKGNELEPIQRLASVNAHDTIYVSSNTRWVTTVTSPEGNGWCSIINGTGSQNGFFIIEASPNRTGSELTALVTVHATDAEGSFIENKNVMITFIQDEGSISIYPTAVDRIPSTGKQISFTIEANQPWELTSLQEYTESNPNGFITFLTPKEGDGDKEITEVILSIGSNLSGVERNATISLESPNQGFAPIKIDIVQNAPYSSFIVTPSDLQTINAEGGTINFNVYSVYDWHIENDSPWIKFEPSSGEASDQQQQITCTVAENTFLFQRQAKVRFVCESNDIEIYFHQDRNYNSLTPTLSIPWVVDGWTDTEATICASFSSIHYEVLEVGIMYRTDNLPGANYWNKKGKVLQGEESHYGEIKETLNNLQPATWYDIRAYAIYKNPENNQTNASYSIITRFLTAGSLPGNLTEDYELEFDESHRYPAHFVSFNYDDEYFYDYDYKPKTDIYTYVIEIMDYDAPYDFFVDILFRLIGNSKLVSDGTYEFNNTLKNFTGIKGVVNSYGGLDRLLSGIEICDYRPGKKDIIAPICGGTVTLTTLNAGYVDDSYQEDIKRLDFDLIDDKGNHITGTLKCSFIYR